MTANRTFLGSVHRNQPEQFEAPAGATLTPGMLAEVSSGEIIPHSTDGGAGFVYVAKELTANFDGNGGLDTDYTAGETAQAYIPTSGDMYRMLVATAQAVGYDTALASDGAGLLVVAGAEDAVICYADEDAGTTDGTTAVRVKFK
ncbi:hypothetical protein [uncultured Halomonas sp.]|uniref:hypothetical protein n=1 Tax=uncultured Halomonas sp. TaxID=173971 RepID=UPI002622D978|nr:hypothetical protein [uncultured Halomonas sp.]